MGGLAHYIEDEGIPTTQIALIRKHAEEIKPPRALAVPFELGRPLGAPNHPEFQRRVLKNCLELLSRDAGPVLEDFPDDPPVDESENEGWVCPINLSIPPESISDEDLVREALEREVALIKPWYEESKKKRGNRTNLGVSGKTPEEIAAFLSSILVNREETASPFEGKPTALAFKQMADDLRYFYMEAAIAKPGNLGTDTQIGNWLWGETILGKVLIAVRDWAMESEDPSFKALAPTAMVPMVQRHRTQHG